MVVLAVTTMLSGCAWFRDRPDTLAPAAVLYEEGERALLKGKQESARESLRKIVERHPDSGLVPRARFLMGESHYRDREYNQAIREFETFITLYPGHEVADFAQYRLAQSYYDQMPTLERDQAITAKAMAEFQNLLKRYPESRYAPDAIVKIEACRLRLAQKELWIADFYVRRDSLQAALQRYDVILKEYPRTAVAPEALFQKVDVLMRLDRDAEAAQALRRLVDGFPASEWSRRARERHAQLL
jgi:outer membrane protein assembly factor BamD